jgi:hypothetical protein
MNQSALLNSVCYFSFLHFPISEDKKNSHKSNALTFDHVQHVHAVCPYIHICRFYWGFLHVNVIDVFVTATLTFISIVMQFNPFQPSDAIWHHTVYLPLICMSFAR